MSVLPDIPVCILAGGKSERFGSNKALADLNGKPLIARTLERLELQSSGPIAINTDWKADFVQFARPVIDDAEWTGQGPLAGILSAMGWARVEGFDQVLTVAVDLPLLPTDLIARLTSSGTPAIAASVGRWHPVIGVWACEQFGALEAYLQEGRRSAHGWAEVCGASVVDFDPAPDGRDPFWNVNTPEQLKEVAEQGAA